MDSLSTPVVSVAKLPILNPNEFDLWKMRIEQYFLMTDYSLWEVIINGDSPAPTVVIDGVVRPVTLFSADQKLARRNELKACGTLLMALADKHLLKFNSHKDAKSLMQAIEKRFGGNTETKKKLVSQLEIHGVSLSQEDVNLKFLHSLPSEWKTHTLIWRNKDDLEEHSLNDLFNSLRIYEAKVKHSSTLGNPTQNLAFVSSSNTDSTTDSVSAATSVSAMAMLTMRARRKGHFTRECRSPKDIKRIGAAEPQRRHVPVETSTSNALVSQCDGIGSYDWSYQAEEEPANFALMAITSSSSSSDSLESVEARLVIYKQNESILQENINMLKNEVETRDNVLVTRKQKLNHAEKERDDLKLKFDKFQTSSQSLTELLSSQKHDKQGLGYCSSGNDYESLSPNCPFDRLEPNGGYNAVPPPITGNFMLPKPDLVFHTAPIVVETDHSAFTVQLSPAKPAQDIFHTTKPMAPIIED
nr:hypothetical protein [Tanacetum cinerariifolium]